MHCATYIAPVGQKDEYISRMMNVTPHLARVSAVRNGDGWSGNLERMANSLPSLFPMWAKRVSVPSQIVQDQSIERHFPIAPEDMRKPDMKSIGIWASVLDELLSICS